MMRTLVYLVLGNRNVLIQEALGWSWFSSTLKHGTACLVYL
jgi:hypothetical protein